MRPLPLIRQGWPIRGSSLYVSRFNLACLWCSFCLFTGPGPVSALRVEPRLTSILLTWSAPQELNGVLVNYEVTYRVNDGDVIAVNITDTAFTIPLLTPSTTVSGISIRAYNNVGRGAVAQYDDVDTLPEPHLRKLRSHCDEGKCHTRVQYHRLGIMT